MKKCPYCGKTCSGDEAVCPLDETVLAEVSEQGSPAVPIVHPVAPIVYTLDDKIAYATSAAVFLLSLLLVLADSEWGYQIAAPVITFVIAYAHRRGHLTQLHLPGKSSQTK